MILNRDDLLRPAQGHFDVLVTLDNSVSSNSHSNSSIWRLWFCGHRFNNGKTYRNQFQMFNEFLQKSAQVK